MTGRNDRLAWPVAIGLLAGVALVGGLAIESRRDEVSPTPAANVQFFVVTLA